MRVFGLSDVAPGSSYKQFDAHEAMRGLSTKRVEAVGCATPTLVSCEPNHAFAEAARRAFYDHHPLVIRPDDIWFCIAQGLATHVSLNSEALRSRFVAHEGRKKLVVSRPDFLLGQDNPWPEMFSAFSEQIAQNIPQLRDILGVHFSTTTAMETAAFDLCWMDAFKDYFEYEARCGCGIPQIILHGTAEDWRSMIPRLQQMAEYGLEEWCATLVPVLEKIADTAAGNIDREFWLSFFRYLAGSGPAELTGWIVTLFPYLIVDWRTGALGPNEYLSAWRERLERSLARSSPVGDWMMEMEGPGLGSLPQSLASAPLRFIDVRDESKTNLRLVAGMFGVAQAPENNALSASFGWSVVYDDAEVRSRRQFVEVTF
ncbi:DUF4419 domain-containing protein [Agrobacterium rhizogenes]|uniref:DUF4419 domain-containing protein n=1 Tax=Rhizobium rhizogenes TaxID=359 RepID=UPI00115D6940|nr:DUF4419 domain-containing protein [Rhizobium rhizogenes]NTI03119.1 DUF4419 domain-containing protein [Rhizobium rhizogenes]NTI09923.1 DUF4419 domain-containing protein [Rhizobium rhizogenes]TRB20268.1 DUF4419 domain-containing protein [Rhizobium rhizogenes]